MIKHLKDYLCYRIVELEQTREAFKNTPSMYIEYDIYIDAMFEILEYIREKEKEHE